MERRLDNIRFESRAEIREMMRIIEHYVDAYPKEKDNETLKRFYNLLDDMDIRIEHIQYAAQKDCVEDKRAAEKKSKKQHRR